MTTESPNMTRVLEEVLALRRRLDGRDHVKYSLPLQRFLDESVTYSESVMDPEDWMSVVRFEPAADVVPMEDDVYDEFPSIKRKQVPASRPKWYQILKARDLKSDTAEAINERNAQFGAENLEGPEEDTFEEIKKRNA